MRNVPAPNRETPRRRDDHRRKKIDPLIVIGGSPDWPEWMNLLPFDAIDGEDGDPNP